MKAKLAEHMKQYMAMPDVKAKRPEYMQQHNQQYMARPGMKAKKAEYNKRYMARPEVKAKRAEQQYMARLEVKAKRAEQMKQYNQQNEMVLGCHGLVRARGDSEEGRPSR